MMNKRGGPLINTITGLPIVAIGTLILIFLIVGILPSTTFNKTDKMSESYFKSFERVLNSVNSGGTEDFSMIKTNVDASFYLVYFGGVSTFGKFAYLGDGKNMICVCSVYKKSTMCKYCKNLDLPIDYIMSDGKHSDIPWDIAEGVRLDISKKGGHYEFKAK